MTAADTRPEAEAEQGARPFVAPGYALRKVPFDAPYSWLAAGWRDMGRVPRVSLAYGAIFAIAGVLLSVGLTAVGLQSESQTCPASRSVVPPKAAGGGGICCPSIVVVELGEPGTPLVCWALATGDKAVPTRRPRLSVHNSLFMSPSPKHSFVSTGQIRSA